MKRRKLNYEDVKRRLEFLIQECRQPDPIYCQAVRMAFRVVTNFYCVEDDRGSAFVRKALRHRSRAAHELMHNKPESLWAKSVTNEHQEQLGKVWRWMVDNRDTITPELVEERLRKWPMVVITKEENRRLDKKPSENPTQRYEVAEICVLCRHDDGEWRDRS